MADRFYKDIEIPDISVTLPAPDPGFVQIYGKNGKLAYQNSTGTETILDFQQQEAQIVSSLIIDGGSASTTPQQVALKIDFGLNS